MTTHTDVIEALGPDQWRALQSSGLPLMVTNELLSIWLEGWPDRFAALARSGDLVRIVGSMAAGLRTARDLAGDPSMSHVGMAEKLELAGLPLVLVGDSRQ